MSDNITGLGNIAGGPGRSGDDGPKVQQGSREGGKVEHHVHGGTSEIAQAAQDAAEELTMMGSQKAGEKGSKKEKVKNRKVETSQKTQQTEKSQMMQKFLDKLPELKGNIKFEQFPDTIKQLGRDASKEDILKRAEEDFDDVTHQHAALSYAMEVLRSEGPENKELADKVESVIRDLVADPVKGPHIRAGYNVTVEANKIISSLKKTGHPLGDISATELRDHYRDLITLDEGEDTKTISDVYSQVFDRAGNEGFTESLGAMIRLTGQDMENVGGFGPSQSKERLQSNVDLLYSVQALGNTRRDVLLTLERVDTMLPGGIDVKG